MKLARLGAGLALLSGSSCVEIDPSYANVGGSGETASEASSGTASDGSGEGETEAASTGPQDGTNLAFVSSATIVANFGALEAADQHCNTAAQAAGLPGTYVAWVSNGSTDAPSRLGSASGWLRTDGRVFARDRQALVSADVTYPLLLDESGGLVSPSGVEFVYTGTDGLGAATPDHCLDWSSNNDADFGGFGFTDGGGGVWTSSGSVSCNGQARLYCLGVDFDAPVEVAAPPADARLTFTTTALLDANAGRDAADQLCATEAAAAGHPGTFLALMAVPGEALFDRHDLGGGPWVRADGAIALPAGLQPSAWNELVEAPLVLGIDGALILTAQFWSGVISPTEIATDDTTCMGWTDPAHPRRPTSWTAYANWLDGLTETPCDTPLPVVCLEQ